MASQFTDAQKQSFAHLRALKAQRAASLKKARIEKTQKTWTDKHWFRVYHFAHCILRGRSLEQIENMRGKPEYAPESTWLEKLLMDRVNEIMLKVSAGTFHEA